MNKQSHFQPISFVIPAHNEENFLPKTLHSLLASANSLGLDYEVIVVNDASTDGTANVIDSVSESVADEGNCHRSVSRLDVNLRNIGAVRNAGAKVAMNNWLIFIDADTEVPQDVLSDTINALKSGAIGGGAWVKISDDGKLPIIKWLLYKILVFVWQYLNGLAAGCYMYCLKSEFDAFGGFDEEFFAAEELFFSRNLKRRGKFQLVNSAVVTSARKLHSYSTWQLYRFILRPFFTRKGVFRSKVGLELLYEDKR